MARVHLETVLALLFALGSTILVSLAYLRGQAAVQDLPALSLAHPGASLRGLLTSRPWLVGFLMEGGGFAMYVAARARAPPRDPSAPRAPRAPRRRAGGPWPAVPVAVAAGGRHAVPRRLGPRH